MSEPDRETGHILHIGALDATHERIWQQLGHEGLKIEYVRGRKPGLERVARIQPAIVAVSSGTDEAAVDRLCRAVSHLAPEARRLLLTDRRPGPEFPCESYLLRPISLLKLRDTVFQLLDRSDLRMLRAGPLQLDLSSRMLAGPQGEHHLTPKERDLLASFMRRPGIVISRAELMELVWETNYLGDTRTLDVHIRWLRTKIEPEPGRPSLLLTSRGKGYMLDTLPVI